MLRKIGHNWEFNDETELELFLCQNLEKALNLTFLQRQLTLQGERCDIVAVDSSHRLVILELKNTEDRYIVQQLTRYYDALLEEKPFSDSVDYNQPDCNTFSQSAMSINCFCNS